MICRDTFAAGASFYGVADMELLAKVREAGSGTTCLDLATLPTVMAMTHAHRSFSLCAFAMHV